MSQFPDGVTDADITIVARRVLLDALTALKAHRNAITLVGAQAVHLRTADGELTASSYTSDADLGVDPDVLNDEPLLEQIMTDAGFTRGPNPGSWGRPERIGKRVHEVLPGGPRALSPPRSTSMSYRCRASNPIATGGCSTFESPAWQLY